MKEEVLDIYDEQMNLIGSEKRSQVHINGCWHQTFQTWLYCEKGVRKFLIFQKRHLNKEVGGGLYDITAAGHLVTGESVSEGIREIEEELGIVVDFRELIYLGVLNQTYIEDKIIDREFCNVFICKTDLGIDCFRPQTGEVSGIVLIEAEEMLSLITGRKEYVECIGFDQDDKGIRVNIQKELSILNFMPHSEEYYTLVLEAALK
jgi:isopentenyldiphosphate isomerase